MPSLYELAPVTIRESLAEYPKLDLQKLLIAIAKGRIRLYQLIPSEIAVDSSPDQQGFLDLSGLFKISEFKAKYGNPSQLWVASQNWTYGPTALQLDPTSTKCLIEEGLLNLASKGIEAAFEAELFFGAEFIGEDGSPLAVGKHWLTGTDLLPWIDHPDLPQIDSSKLKITDLYLEKAYLEAMLGELVIARESLTYFLKDPERYTESPKEMTNSKQEKPLSHPAKDPSLKIYAPELHVALEIWEALYWRGEKQERIGHTEEAVRYVRKHFPDKGIKESIVRSRIAPVSNTAENKSSGNRDKPDH